MRSITPITQTIRNKDILQWVRRVTSEKSPDLVRQEAWASLLVYQAVSDLITRAAGYARLDPDRVSFTTALNTARRSVNQTSGRFPLSIWWPWTYGRSAS